MFPVLLASSSPRRRQLMEQVGFCVTVVPPQVDESLREGEGGEALAERLASEKARALTRSDWRARVSADPLPQVGVAADTVVWTPEHVLGKPADEAEACEMLAALSGRAHCVTTGFCVFDPADSGRCVTLSVTTEVCFHPLSSAQISAYVATGESMGKAGAYAIQGLGAVLVRGITGSYSNVVGLPIDAVVNTMRAEGYLNAWPWENLDGC